MMATELTKEQKQARAKAAARLRLQEQQSQREAVAAQGGIRLPEGQVVPRQETVPETLRAVNQEMERTGQELEGVTDIPFALGDTFLTLAIGGAGQLGSGLTGIGSLAYEALTGGDMALDATVARMEAVEDALSRDPKTVGGQMSLMHLEQNVIEPFASKMDAVADMVFRQFGPEAATVVKTSPDALLAFLGLRKGTPRSREHVAETEGQLKSIGVDPKASPGKRREQVQAAGDTADNRGASLEAVREGVVRAREEFKGQRDQLYAEARAFRAGLEAPEVRPFVQYAKDSLTSFDVEDMPSVRRRLAELDKINELPNDSVVQIRALEEWRQKISRNRPKNQDGEAGPEAAANDILKAQYDNWIVSKFNADMISGSDAAIAKWREAIAKNTEFKRRFSDIKAIRDMAFKDATPEEMRRWIFGAAQTGFKPMASKTVARLKEVLGENSPEMAALRNDALLNVMDPLLMMEPNFRQFVKNYDKLLKNNKSIVDELFTPEQQKNLKLLRDTAESTRKAAPDPNRYNFDRAAAVLISPHKGTSLAKGRLQIGLFEKAISMLRRSGSKDNRRKLLGDILGYDPDKRLLGNVFIAAPAIAEGARQDTSQGEDPPGSETRGN